MTPEDAARLDLIILKVAKKKVTEGRHELDELISEAWVYAHDPVRAKTVQHHLDNEFQDANHAVTVGETFIRYLVDEHLTHWMREQRGLPPLRTEKPTYGWGQQTVEIHHQSRHVSSDGDADEWSQSTLEEAFPYSDGAYKQGYTVQHVEAQPEARPHRKGGPYGASQVFPFGIIQHARDIGVISEYQATLLQFLMDGDSAKDLACRYPEESYGAIQTAVSKALTALRKEPKIQEWGQSLGHNPLALKGERWVSEHRHNDGLPGAPVPQRPFVCDCNRGEANYDEHALDRSDPFLALLESGSLLAA